MYTYSTEEKQDNGHKSSNTTDNGAPENPLGCIDTCILRLFCHVAGSIEANQDSSSCEIGKAPVPAFWSPSTIIGGHECFVSSSETPGVCSPDWEPDDVEEEVKKDKC